MCNFNPRSREGSDVIPLADGMTGAISIPAPAWAANSVCQLVLPFLKISIHAPARGATQLLFQIQASAEFQSTLPRGERRKVG